MVRGDTNQDDTNQDNTNQDDMNQDNTNQDNTNQDDTNQDNTNQDGGLESRRRFVPIARNKTSPKYQSPSVDRQSPIWRRSPAHPKSQFRCPSALVCT